MFEQAQVIDATTAAARPDLQVYVAKHNLGVGGKTFAPGHRLQFTDPDQIAELRAFDAIALEEEIRAAEDLAAERQRQARENEELRNMVAQLEAQLVAAQARNWQTGAVRGKGGRFTGPTAITGSAENPGTPVSTPAAGSALGDSESGDEADEE